MKNNELSFKKISEPDDELYNIFLLNLPETIMNNDEMKEYLYDPANKNRLAIVLDSKEIIGFFDYEINQKLAVFNYYLKPNYFHLEIIEILKAIISYLFNQNVDEIRSDLYQLNNTSQKVLEKCGFNFLYTIKRPCGLKKNLSIPYNVYSLKRFDQDHIMLLSPENYKKCINVGNFKKHPNAMKWYQELVDGNCMIYVYVHNNQYIGEGALIIDSHDNDYTIPHQRVYLSRLIVKPEYRRQGIATKIVEYLLNKATEMGFKEATIGVDLNNHIALHLYEKFGFNSILYRGKDEYGEFLKLMKVL